MTELQIVAVLISLLGTTISLNFTLRGLSRAEKRENEFASIHNTVATQRAYLSKDLRTRLSEGASSKETFETISTYLDAIVSCESKLKGNHFDASKRKHVEVLITKMSLSCAIIGSLVAIVLHVYS